MFFDTLESRCLMSGTINVGPLLIDRFNIQLALNPSVLWLTRGVPKNIP